MLLGRSLAQRVEGHHTKWPAKRASVFQDMLVGGAFSILQNYRERSELAFAAKNFNSIEINGTHYSLQRPEYFAQWAAETPDDFVFAVKGSRFITHMKKLRDVEDALANFFAQFSYSSLSGRRRRGGVYVVCWSGMTAVTLHLNPGITLVCFQSFSGI
jgi:Protein of unknown function DUF72